jgi:hypothetical protein
MAEIVKQTMQGMYTRATTRRGHLQERVESVERPMRKDFGVIFEHVNQVIHDLAYHEYLIDANRLLRAGAIDGAIREHYGPEVLGVMRDVLKDVAAGEVPAQTAFERGMNYLRTGSDGRRPGLVGDDLVAAADRPDAVDGADRPRSGSGADWEVDRRRRAHGSLDEVHLREVAHDEVARGDLQPRAQRDPQPRLERRRGAYSSRSRSRSTT